MTNPMKAEHIRADTDWFRDAKWGVLTHYLADDRLTPEQWNEQVDRFDVEGLADQLSGIGAKYYFITIGQNSGHYCATNEAYDSFVGIRPSKCSKRDLISDLYEVLNPRGIKLMVYLPSGAPDRDPVAREKLEWEPGIWEPRSCRRLASFQVRWEAVIGEWSLRWGTRICGWWIDGCYYADSMYRHTDPPNFQSFAAALKAGNPNSVIAFNPGVLTPVILLTHYEDYTAGEIDQAFPVCPGRWVDGAQYHILSYLGETWGKGKPRFVDEFVLGYTRNVTAKGGVVTWDAPISKGGLIEQPFVDQLSILGSL